MTRIYKLLMVWLSFMIAVVSGNAQITVKSFEELPFDLDASTYFPKKDWSGKTCAIIKIFTTQKGFSFDNGTLGIFDVDYDEEKHPAEIWLYVPESTMKLKIVHAQLGHIQNSQYNDGYYWFTRVKGGKCYKMELECGKGWVEPEEKKTGYLTFNTDPEGAEVYLGPEGGELKYYDVTPFQLKLEYGTYNFRLKHMKYKDEMGRAVIDKEQVDLGLMRLVPDFGSVSVTSEPAGAEVYLDGQNTGKRTPCVLDEVMSGTHSVRLNCEGYAPYSQEVKVAANAEPVMVNAVMDARFAPITINTLPNVEIKVDGEVRGTGTCTINLPMSVHDITASLAGHRSVSRQINVTDNTPQTIELNPTPIYGSLDVETMPIGATITINGVNYGKAPRTVRDLLVGEQIVTLSKEGYADITRTITIREHESSLLKVDMRKYQSTSAPTPTTPDLVVSPSSTTQLKKTVRPEELQIKWAKGVTAKEKKTAMIIKDNMVFVEGGTFKMGATEEQKEKAAADESPVHSVTLNDYMIGKYEVTQAEWYTIMEISPSKWSGMMLPVEQVSYNDCVAFVEKLSEMTGLKFRLPTEAEWEYAARGGQKVKPKKKNKNKYSGSNEANDVAWYDNKAGYKTHEVGKKDPNELGIYDMSGNVSEWCSDNYAPYSSGAQVNPQITASTPDYVVRGGSCQSEAGHCRVSKRDYRSSEVKERTIGFRVVLDLTK